MNVTKVWAAQLDDYAIDLAWSPEGRVLAVASAAGPVTLFDRANGRKRHELPAMPMERTPSRGCRRSSALSPTRRQPWTMPPGRGGREPFPLSCHRRPGRLRAVVDADAGSQVAETQLAAGPGSSSWRGDP